MARMVWNIILFCTLIGLSTTDNTTAERTYIEHENALFAKLVGDTYNKDVFPRMSRNRPVEVLFSLELQNLQDLNEEEQVLYTLSRMHMEWHDSRLTWNISDYGGIDSIRIPATDLWIPDIALYNNLDEYRYGFGGQELGYKPIIQNDGHVFWIVPTWLGSRCQIDLQDFPYDAQHCMLKFGSWTYSKFDLDLQLTYDHPHFVGESTNTFHHEFEITNFTNTMKVEKYACCPEEYPSIIYTIDLKRHSTFATHLIVAPTVVVTLMVPVAFILPSDSPAKVTFGTGLMITEALLLEILIDMMPTPHPTVPNLGIYHVTSIILIGISLAFSVIVLNLSNKGNRNVHMPDFVKLQILPIVGKILLVQPETYQAMPNNNYNRMEMSNEEQSTTTPDDDTTVIIKPIETSKNGCEWRHLTAIIDRICFITFVIVVFVTTFAFGLK